MRTQWPTTWETIRMTAAEYEELSDILMSMSNDCLHVGDSYTLTGDQVGFLAGWFHAYFAEGYFQGDKWKARLLAEGHTIND
jgi:hypothetical protein